MPLSSVDTRGTIFSCAGKRVLITGASSGFGEHFAETVARAGASSVALAARRVARLEKLAARIRAIDGVSRNIVCVACDVSSAESIRRAFDEAQEQAGVDCFDVIINNAGIGTDGKFLDVPECDYDKLMAVNARGCWIVAQEGARRMKECSRAGSIVNIASIYGLRVGVAHSAYSATKAAVVHMTKAMALDFSNLASASIASVRDTFGRDDDTGLLACREAIRIEEDSYETPWQGRRLLGSSCSLQ